MRCFYFGALLSSLVSLTWARTSDEGYVARKLWGYDPVDYPDVYSPVDLHVSNAEKIVYSFDQTPPAVTKINQTDGSLIGVYEIPLNDCFQSPNDPFGRGRDSTVQWFAVHSDNTGKAEFFIILVNDYASQRHNGDGRMLKMRADTGDIEWTKYLSFSHGTETDECTAEPPTEDNRIDIYGGKPVLDKTGTFIYVQVISKAIACFTTSDGEEFWRNDVGVRMSNLALHQNGLIYAGKRDDEDYPTNSIGGEVPKTQPRIYSFDSMTGNVTEVWSSATIEADCFNPIINIVCYGSIRSRPVISPDDTFLYVFDEYAGLMKLLIDENGFLEEVYFKREHSMGSPVAPVLNEDGTVLYGVDFSGTPTAYSTADGAILWKTDQMWSLELGADVQYHHHVVFYSYDDQGDGGNFYAIHAKDGAIIVRTDGLTSSNTFELSEDLTTVFCLDHTLNVKAFYLLPPTPPPTPNPTTPFPTLIGYTHAPTASPTTASPVIPTAPPTTAMPTPIPTLVGMTAEPTPPPVPTESPTAVPTTAKPTTSTAARFGGGIGLTVIFMLFHYVY